MVKDERAKELAEWLHHLLCAAQNLPWEEGDCCDDCVENVKEGVLPLLAQVQAEARRNTAIEIAMDLEDLNIAALAGIAADIRKNYAVLEALAGVSGATSSGKESDAK